MKLREKFNELNVKNEGALITYICAGDPGPQETKEYVEALVRGGADIIELGLPFSDPMVDGPTIQAGMGRALKAGMTPDLYFEVVRSLNVNIPVVTMTYYNLIFRRGVENFIKDCISSGISGIIVADLPLEESDELAIICKKYNLDLIFLIGPTTTKYRIEKMLVHGSGFIYLVIRPGVTGMQTEMSNSTKELAHDLINRVNTNLPKVVGFGISNEKQVTEIISAGGNGAIVGSAFVNIIADGIDVPQRLEMLTRRLKESCKIRSEIIMVH